MKKVGVIGAGTMGGVHAEAWQSTEADLVGVFDIVPAAAQKLTDKLGIESFPNRESLLEAVDIVDVCVPTPSHKDNVLAAIEAGKHVVCEKPMAPTLGDCADMIRAAEDKGVRLFIAQVVRFFPAYATAKRIIDEGRIGKLGVIRLNRGGGHPGGWFAVEEESGGTLLDLMVHDFDYLRWIAGDVERVYCQRYLSDEGDYSLVTARLRSGAIAHIEGSWAYPAGIFRTSFDIAGDDGLLTFDSERTAPLQVRLKQEEAARGGVIVPSSPLVPEDNPYRQEIVHFYECLLSGEEFMVTPRDAMAAVQIALAARQSWQTGEPVTLETLSV